MYNADANEQWTESRDLGDSNTRSTNSSWTWVVEVWFLLYSDYSDSLSVNCPSLHFNLNVKEWLV